MSWLVRFFLMIVNYKTSQNIGESLTMKRRFKRHLSQNLACSGHESHFDSMILVINMDYVKIRIWEVRIGRIIITSNIFFTSLLFVKQ